MLNKRQISLLVFISPFLFYFFVYMGVYIQSGALFIADAIKRGYWTTNNSVSMFWNKHISQASRIENLKETDIENQLLKSQVAQLQAKLNNIQKGLKAKIDNQNIQFARILSYVKMGAYNKVWLDYYIQDEDDIAGLIYSNYTVGIAKKQNNRTMAFLNRDTLSSYAVYVGKDKATGILIGQGDRSSEVIVDFIPIWYKISKGDEVITSGKDGIFFEGLKVGKVTKVNKHSGYLRAKVLPYFNSYSRDYLWVVD